MRIEVSILKFPSTAFSGLPCVSLIIPTLYPPQFFNYRYRFPIRFIVRHSDATVRTLRRICIKLFFAARDNSVLKSRAKSCLIPTYYYSISRFWFVFTCSILLVRHDSLMLVAVSTHHPRTAYPLSASKLLGETSGVFTVSSLDV